MGNVNRMEQDALTFVSTVTAVRPHGRFNRRTYLNNLALLEVNSIGFSFSFELITNSSILKLPSVVFGITVIPKLISSEVITDSVDCYVLGWSSNSVRTWSFTSSSKLDSN